MEPFEVGDVVVEGDHPHRMVVYSAVPGGESYGRLRLLAVVGSQALR